MCHLESLRSKSISYLCSLYGDPIFFYTMWFLHASFIGSYFMMINYTTRKVYIYHIFGRIGSMCVCSFSFHRVRHEISSSSFIVYFSKVMPCCISVSVDLISHYACELLWEPWQNRLQCSFARFLMTSLCLHVDKLIGEPSNCSLTYLL